MKITKNRIKEIIREELAAMDEGTPFEDANLVTVPGVGPQGFRRSLNKGGGLQLANDDVRAAFAEALGEPPYAVYEMESGPFQALVEFEDGRLVKIKLGGGFLSGTDSEDVDAEVDAVRDRERDLKDMRRMDQERRPRGSAY